jgi:hypothetical protein
MRNGVLDQLQNLLLTGGEFGGGQLVHGYLFGGTVGDHKGDCFLIQ